MEIGHVERGQGNMELKVHYLINLHHKAQQRWKGKTLCWHIPLVVRGDETAAANDRCNGSGAVARVLCPRQGGDAGLIISKASADV
jgi:hypothetical protein